MATPVRDRTLLTAMGRHLGDPMRRSAYALILATGLTSGLGLVFWALAARWLSTATVGIGAALISAMALLANLATLGLRNGLIRFLPTAGSASRRLILTSYALCAAAAVVAAILFLIGQPLWATRLDFLRTSPLAVLAFVVGTALWVVFVLQDHVLVGLRQAAWIPLENGLCSLAKIALLPLLALTGGWAVFGAAVIPAAAAVVIVTALILRFLGRTTRDGPRTTIPVTQLVRFAAADHLAALLWMATADLLTLLVLDELGPEASAYYFLANTIGYTLYLVVSNVGSALVAEGARRPEDTVRLARQAAWNAARLVAPLVVVGVLAAPLLLGVLGPDYAANGTVVLQLLLLSALPQVLVGTAVATARIRRDLRTVMGVYAALALGSIGGSWLTLDTLGLPGVGWSCLITQLLVASVLVVTGRTGLVDGGGHGLVAELEGLPRRLRRRRSERRISRQLDPALVACGLEPVGRGYLPLTSDSDALVAAVEAEGRPVILKIATSAAAADGLKRHTSTVDRLRARLDDTTADLLPETVRTGALADHRVLVETRLPGTSSQAWQSDPRVGAGAVAALSEIHRATSVERVVDDELLTAWVDRPLDLLRGMRALPGDPAALDRLGQLLRDGIRGQRVAAAVVHGDFWSGNVLIEWEQGDSADVPGPGMEDDRDAARVRVTGLVDWENSVAQGLPDADLLHWWFAAQPVELGAAVRSALTAPRELSHRLADAGIDLPNPQLAVEHVVLLTWLWHVTAGMRRTSAEHLGRVWLYRNVKPVLLLLADPSFGSGIGTAAVGPDPISPAGEAS